MLMDQEPSQRFGLTAVASVDETSSGVFLGHCGRSGLGSHARSGWKLAKHAKHLSTNYLNLRTLLAKHAKQGWKLAKHSRHRSQVSFDRSQVLSRNLRIV
jgi:hypothetical protein